MKSAPQLLAVAVATAIYAPTLMAAEMGFVGAAGVQIKQLEMEQNFKGFLTENGDLSAVLPVLNVQVVGFYDQLYVALKVETSLATDDVSSDVPFTTESTSLTTEVTRSDYSIALGYKLQDSLSLFAGYMAGETELTPASCSDGSCTNPASEMRRDGFGTYRQIYQEEGFFAGASYGWGLGPGRLNASLAYAMMDGEYSDNFRDEDGQQKFRYEGDSDGVSAALTWVAPLTESVAYYVDGRMQQYEMDAEDKSGIARFADSRVETVERILGITLGIQMV